MPVVFEQPDPMGYISGAAQGGGYVAQYNADRQFGLQAAALRQQAQGLNQARAMQEQQMQLQAGIAQAQVTARGQVTPAEQYAAGQQQQAQQVALGGQQAMAQQRALEQQQLFAQQKQLLQQKQAAMPAMFTQGDSNRRLQLQQAQSANDEQRFNGTITPQVADARDAMIQPEINALNEKEQKWKTHLRNTKAANDIDNGAIGTAGMVSGLAQLAKAHGSPDGRLTFQADPDDPNSPWISLDSKGVPHHLPRGPGSGNPALKEQEEFGKVLLHLAGKQVKKDDGTWRFLDPDERDAEIAKIRQSMKEFKDDAKREANEKTAPAMVDQINKVVSQAQASGADAETIGKQVSGALEAKYGSRLDLWPQSARVIVDRLKTQAKQAALDRSIGGFTGLTGVVPGASRSEAGTSGVIPGPGYQPLQGPAPGAAPGAAPATVGAATGAAFEARQEEPPPGWKRVPPGEKGSGGYVPAWAEEGVHYVNDEGIIRQRQRGVLPKLGERTVEAGKQLGRLASEVPSATGRIPSNVAEHLAPAYHWLVGE